MEPGRAALLVRGTKNGDPLLGRHFRELCCWAYGRDAHATGCLVAVVVGFVWAVFVHAEVSGLFVAEDGEFDADLLEVEAGDFFV